MRAIAVLSVVLFHLGLDIKGGFLGVDIFFVISGYLITKKIVYEVEHNTFCIYRFWNRRFRRILPAMFAVTLTTLLIGYFILLPIEYTDLAKSALFQSIFSSNIFFWNDVGYFLPNAESKPLLHLWSLSVEEQFYLIFPIIFIAKDCLKLNTIYLMLLFLCFFSLVLFIYGTIYHERATFYLLPTRIWEFGAGAVVALTKKEINLNNSFRTILSYIIFISMIIPLFISVSNINYAFFYNILIVISTALYIYFYNQLKKTIFSYFLRNKIIVFIGLISYSLYLWHWPVVTFFKFYYHELPTEVIIQILFICFVFSYLTWMFVEKPFRSGLLNCKNRLVYKIGFSSLLIISIVSGTIYANKGFPERYPSNLNKVIENITWNGSKFQYHENKFNHHNLKSIGIPEDLHSQKIDFILIGDSHAQVFCHLFDEISTELGLTGKALVRPSFIPIPKIEIFYRNNLINNPDIFHDLMSYIKDNKIKNIILMARWARYLGYTNPGKNETSIYPEGSDGNINIASNILQGFLLDFVKFCETNEIFTYMVLQTPETSISFPAKNIFNKITNRDNYIKTNSNYLNLDEYKNMIKDFENIIKTIESDNFHVIDLSKNYFHHNGKLKIYDGFNSLYRDNDHLTQKGVSISKTELENTLLKIKNY